MSEQTDPRTAHHQDGFPPQGQEQPGHTDKTVPAPDHGENSYTGSSRLHGKRALITGGDSGIGRAVAIAFSREGADVAIVHGLEDLATDEFERVFRTNLSAMIFTALAAIPHLKAGASIIVTSSIQAFNPSPGLIDYAMTKAAQVAFLSRSSAPSPPTNSSPTSATPSTDTGARCSRGREDHITDLLRGAGGNRSRRLFDVRRRHRFDGAEIRVVPRPSGLGRALLARQRFARDKEPCANSSQSFSRGNRKSP